MNGKCCNKIHFTNSEEFGHVRWGQDFMLQYIYVNCANKIKFNWEKIIFSISLPLSLSIYLCPRALAMLLQNTLYLIQKNSAMSDGVRTSCYNISM